MRNLRNKANEKVLKKDTHTHTHTHKNRLLNIENKLMVTRGEEG